MGLEDRTVPRSQVLTLTKEAAYPSKMLVVRTTTTLQSVKTENATIRDLITF
jgi:hypothetical protein